LSGGYQTRQRNQHSPPPAIVSDPPTPILNSQFSIFNFIIFSRTLPQFQKIKMRFPMKFSTATTFKFAILLTVFFLMMIPDGRSQEAPTSYSFGLSYSGGSSDLPFWLYANRDAKFQRGSSNNGLAEFGLQHRLLDDDTWKINLGSDLAARLSDETNTLHFQQLFLEVNLGVFQLKTGKFYDAVGLNEHDLSVGSMMVSRNTTPIPRIRFSTPDFVEVPGAKGYVEFKARFSEGLLEENRAISNAKLHQKHLYLKINPTEELSLFGGIVHNVMWGGERSDGRSSVNSFNDYLRAIFGSKREGGPTPPGNTVAAYDFATEYRFNDFSLKAYRLFYLEDLVSTRFRSPWDGMWGLSFKLNDRSKLLHSLLYEHVNTKQQDARGIQPPGRARYYWHFFYTDGWTFNNNVLGLPLVTFDENGNLENNIFIAHHLGFEGALSTNLNYKMMATYSRNYGTCLDILPDFSDLRECPIDQDANLDEITIVPLGELREDQYSVMLTGDYRLPSVPNLTLNLSVAFDIGEFYNNRSGVMAGVRLDGIF